MSTKKETKREYYHKYYLTNKYEILKKQKERRKKSGKRVSPEKSSVYNKRNYDKIRSLFLEMYGYKCACCGETTQEFLTIEHRMGQEGRKRETSYISYRTAIKEYCPDVYEILCMNCNHSLGIRGYCPHHKDSN